MIIQAKSDDGSDGGGDRAGQCSRGRVCRFQIDSQCAGKAMEAKCLDKLSKAVGKGQKEICGLRVINPGDCDVKGPVQGEKEGAAKETEKEQSVRWKESQENTVS